MPPNTANNPKPLPPEHAITNTNNQPIPPFNSYNNAAANSQFQNFSQTSENVNFTQSSNTSQNFSGNQYSPQEFTGRPVSNNQDFNNYPQNVNDGNYYHQGEYGQNNYWPRGNDNGNFYNNAANSAASSSTDDYYQSTSQSTSSSFSGEYGAQNEPSQSSFTNQNYNFDVNQPLGYPNEFPSKSDGDGMSNFNVANAAMLDANLLSELSNPSLGGDCFPGMNNDEYGVRQAQMDNVPHFAGQSSMNENRADMPPSQPPAMQSFNQPVRGPPNSNNLPFASYPPQPLQKKRPGRPPLPHGRAANRQRNPNYRGPKQREIRAAAPFPNFKPGLPGGAPILKSDNQNFQNVPPARAGAGDDMNANVVPSGSYQPGQINAPLLDNIQNEELWNPNAGGEPNPLFHDQGYGMYNDMATQNPPPFIPAEANSLLGGVRAPQSLLNEMTNNEMFNPSSSNYPQAGGDANLFGLGNFGYLNDVPMPGHTSFMDLLQGVEDSMEINQNEASSTPAAPPEEQYNVPCGLESQSGNFIEQRMQYPAADVMSSVSAEGKREVPPLPPREANENVMEMSRNGQMALKAAEKSAEPPAPLPVPPEKPSASSASGDFASQNRLPSIDVFNTSQNFSAGSQTNAFGSPYSYEKSRSTTSTSLSTQTSWDSFGGSQTGEYSATVAEGSQNFPNFPATGKSETPLPYQNESRVVAGSRDTFDAAEGGKEQLGGRFAGNQGGGLINVSEQTKVDERGYYSASSKAEGDQGKGQVVGGLSPKMDQKPLPRRNQGVGFRVISGLGLWIILTRLDMVVPGRVPYPPCQSDQFWPSKPLWIMLTWQNMVILRTPVSSRVTSFDYVHMD